MLSVLRVNRRVETGTDNPIPVQPEIAAVCFIYKDMGPIREKPADELGLDLDNIPVSFFAL